MVANAAETLEAGNAYPATRRLLDRRSRRYRDLVVAVALVGLAAPAAAVVFWDWRPLLVWLLAVPIVGLFLWLDARAVARWRSALLGGWVAGTLDLDALCDGLSGVKVLPTRTVAGMVDPLPARARLGCFPDPPPLIREALALTVRAIECGLLKRLGAGVAVLTTATALLASAAASGSAWPLAGLPVAFALARLTRRIGSHPPRHWVREVAKLRKRGLDAAAFTTLAARLAWDSLSPRAYERWFPIEGHH